MKLFSTALFASVAVIALSGPVMAASSTTVTKQTTTTTTAPISGTHANSMIMETSPVVTAPAVSTTTVTTAPGVSTTVITPVTSTVVTEKTTSEKPIVAVGTQAVDFMAYDANKDGILSMNEVGEMLFKLYDTDGNQVLDNIEFERKAVLTITPVEKMTVVKYDFNNDGIADQANYNYETFLKDTQLSRFDQNKDGLSPHEFTGREFIVADINNDKVVDLNEWKGSYIASIDKKNKFNAQTNK